MKKLSVFVLFSILLSCASFDVEDAVRDSGFPAQGGPDPGPPYPQPVPGAVVIERPVYVPAPEAPPPRPQAGQQAAAASNRDGIVAPQDYSRAAMIYDYSPDFVYEVYTRPLRVSDISLQPGELAVEPPFVSDSERWIIGAGVSYENGVPVQHFYIKPASPGISASLVINTNKRAYHVILRSFSEAYMPIVRWRYPPGLPANYIAPAAGGEGAGGGFAGVDPRFLSFDYRVTYGLFSKPYWLPELAFDDGSKTYIRFPGAVLQREMPAVFENRNDVLNYRVAGNLIVIDKLAENITVRIGRTEIAVTKKRRPDGQGR
jgi:type IV secretion system protein VirB9